MCSSGCSCKVDVRNGAPLDTHPMDPHPVILNGSGGTGDRLGPCSGGLCFSPQNALQLQTGAMAYLGAKQMFATLGTRGGGREQSPPTHVPHQNSCGSIRWGPPLPQSLPPTPNCLKGCGMRCGLAQSHAAPLHLEHGGEKSSPSCGLPPVTLTGAGWEGPSHSPTSPISSLS